MSTGACSNAIAFLNPDGSLVLQLQNPEDKPVVIRINVDKSTLSIKLPALSWNTLTAQPV